MAAAKDLAAVQPEKLTELAEQMRKIYAEVQSESPVGPNREWPRDESKRAEWPSYDKRPVTRAKAR